MKKRAGFTIIEVSLFIALTGLIFAAFIIGTSNAITQQRYSDGTNEFAEFLRRLYSQVASPQGVSTGRSDRAIYGKLVTFGEEYDLDGNHNTEGAIFTYDLVGDASGVLSNDFADLSGFFSPVIKTTALGGHESIVPAGITEKYLPAWGIKVENTSNDSDASRRLYKGALVIVRSPISGTIYTLATDNTNIRVNTSAADPPADPLAGKSLYDLGFSMDVVDFCLRMDGYNMYGGLRRDIRLTPGTTSSVELIELNKIATDTDKSGNRCAKLN